MRTVLVTGAGRNIGLAVARQLAAAGHRVALNARSAQAVEAATEAIVADGGSAVAVPGDVADGAAVRAAVDRAGSAFGEVDVLVHCAGIRVHRDFLDLSDDEWSTPLRVGLDGAFHCAQAVLPAMVRAGWGRLVFVAGVSGQTGAAHRASVVTAKAGLIGLTRALALEFAATGVTVNAISPGMIDTERGPWTSQGDQATTAAHYAGRVGRIPLGRMGRLDEVTAAVEYLVSEQAGFVTGQTLNVNGGMYLA
ncbi:SDR family NAD(P)-dependent oxidoreductase [Jiangella asiatica]|uniref:SDR family oxidoreductase n=1 Tax=Jiangella asiatica TaxID=2530372 RepID=A0A4R5D7X9_9ACTN|nr:SDR family NAD(P)-dependent oxidoreductase [Jiangella asiatica]TDE07444.1 SDR family oxidoreductase [Jiangella asiatica]